MTIDIQKEINEEIQDIMDTLSKKFSNFYWSDDHYFEVDTPFETNPGSNNKEWKNKIGLVFYPELLSYQDEYFKRREVTVPWICVQFELENDGRKIERELCKWIIHKFQEAGFVPFKDEDSFHNHFHKEERNGYTKYKFFINSSYPEGYWENHVL